jgi:type II secretory pathway predicted ATPase ExeA
MYQSYWGLQKSLFTPAAARESLAASPVHAEALARLDFLRESQCPFGLLLGPAGSGKSTVLAEFAERAERSGAVVAIASAAAADEQALLAPLAIGLSAGGVEVGGVQLWRRITDRLEELKLENLSAIVLVDDLDRASVKIQSLVERLLALAGAPLTIVATARVETAGRISPRVLEQAALRIDLNPWNESETGDYLASSLTRAGRVQPAFDAAAARRLFELSGGAPRKVNQLAQLALVAGAGQKLVQVDKATIEAVEEELSVGR